MFSCQVIQVVIQTTFIIDGMSRSSNTKQLRKQKPGREFVIFLAICNVAMWIMQTFEVKSHGMDNYRQDFYSREMWSIIGHSCLPLMMFYRYVFGALKKDFQIGFFFSDFTLQFVSSIFGSTPTCLPDISLINEFVCKYYCYWHNQIYIFSKVLVEFYLKKFVRNRFDLGNMQLLSCTYVFLHPSRIEFIQHWKANY